MQQLQLDLKFNWPLQEQLSLDLEDHLIPKAWTATSNVIDSGYLITSSNISGGVLTINTDEVVFRTKRSQSFFQRLVFRLLGLRVEQQ